MADFAETFSALSDRGVSLRAITSEDQSALYHIYASTREDELARLDWNDAQKAAFLAMQFNAQHTYYQEQFPRASFQIIMLDGEPIGRIYIERRKDEIRIIDIALLSAYRNRGIGSAFLEAVIAEAERVALPVRIHVEQFNPALRLYIKLGFRIVGETGVYFLMEQRA
jgi:ribosomal protein S18 acetylase RimI-like enzyme